LLSSANAGAIPSSLPKTRRARARPGGPPAAAGADQQDVETTIMDLHNRFTEALAP
jgi:hypothetical protein